MSAPHIALLGLTKVFLSAGENSTAVDGINLVIQKGEYLTITGHSGSGKTTLLSLVGGLLQPTSGSVVISGCDIYKLAADDLARYRAEKVGFVFQSANLLPSLTVLDNLLLTSLHASRADKKCIQEKALMYLSEIGLSGKADAFPGQLSGGEARRVGLIRALMKEPDILLADEPTGDLDEEKEEQIMTLLEKYHRETENTFILVTHNKGIAGRAQKNLKMSQGRILVKPA